MGNHNENAAVQNQPEQNQQLIQNQDPIDVSLLVEQPSFKKVFAIKNPIYLKKETLTLQKDSTNKNLFYLEFFYDSLCDFNLYINFDVTKNPKCKKSLLPGGEYTPSYLPSKNFEEMTIKFEKLQKGQNVQFLDKKASIDIDFFAQHKAVDEPSTFDIAIEMIPILEGDDSGNEIVFVTLCKLVTEENEAHNHKIKPEQQRLKTQNMWIDMYDVFNCALDTGECLICCSALRNTIFLPCNHSCTCNSCAHSLRMRNNPCPICKNDIDDLLILETEEEKKEPVAEEAAINSNSVRNSEHVPDDSENNNIISNDS